MLEHTPMPSTSTAFFEPLMPLVQQPEEAVALLGDLLASSTETAMVATDLEGQIVLWNAGAARMYGYSPRNAIGRSCAEILQPAADLAQTFAAVLHESKWEGTASCVTPAGEALTTRLAVTIRHNSAGEPIGFVFVARDISSELHLRAELQDAFEEARLKSEFLANMSHELRTPLNGIIGFSELMFDGRVGSLDQQHQQFVGHILNSSRHLLQLINDVLDLAKVDAGQMLFTPELVDLDRVVRQVRDVLRSTAARKGHEVRIEVDPTLGPVVADVRRLKQILYNYLSNAIKFSPARGHITIRVQPVGAAMFRLSVADTGVGVRAEDLGRLFVEFEQLDSSAAKLHQGTGLGLALTKRIVEAQGGMVAVESILGQGSTF